MITYPDAARVLDQAAVYITEDTTVPDAPKAVGREGGETMGTGDTNHDARRAIEHAMFECGVADMTEGMSGFPHGSEICEFVADFGSVPEQDVAVQRARFEGGSMKRVEPDMSDVARSDRRRDDLLQWGRGRASYQVGELYRRAAEELRTKPDEVFGPREVETGFNGEDDLDELVASFSGALGGSNPLGPLGDIMRRLMGEDGD